MLNIFNGITSRSLFSGRGIFSSVDTGNLLVDPTSLVPKFGVVATKDGSTGQTYSHPETLTNVQWYRRNLGSVGAMTLIPGATSQTYVATSADEGKRLVKTGTAGGVLKSYKSVRVVQPPAVVYSLDSLIPAAGTIGNLAAVLTLDTTNKVEGTGAIKATSTGTGSFGPDYTTSETLLPADIGTIAIYVRNLTPAKVTSWNAQLFLGAASTTVSHTADASLDPMGRMISSHVSEHTAVAAVVTPAVLRFRPQAVQTAGAAATEATFDAFARKAEGTPTVLIRFHDSRVEAYTVAYPLMRAFGLVGTLYLATDWVGTDAANYLSWSQVQELANAGWSIALGSTNDAAWTAIGDPMANINTGRAALTTNGLLTPAADHTYWTSNSYTSALADTFIAGGMKTIHGLHPATFHDRFGLGMATRRRGPSQGTNTTTEVVDLTTLVTEAKIRGSTISFHNHAITTAGSGINIRTAIFTSFINDYLGPDYVAGNIDVLNVEQHWDRTGDLNFPTASF